MIKRYSIFTGGLTALFLIAVITALSAGYGFAAEAASGIEFVDTKTVCMVNDRAMGKEQIPVEVGGKTYYGCCKMCVGNLTNKREYRYSTDPVSGNEVDKAAAYIVQKPNGEVFYFESPENAKKHMAMSVPEVPAGAPAN